MFVKTTPTECLRYPYLPIVRQEVIGEPKPKRTSVVVTDGSGWGLLSPNYENMLKSGSEDFSYTVSPSSTAGSLTHGDDTDMIVGKNLQWISVDEYPSEYIKEEKEWADEYDETTSPNNTSTGSSGQQLAIASYINPIGDSDAWTRLLSYDTSNVSLLVANVMNGPDYVVEPNWASVISKAASSGKRIIGYVRTGYLGVSHQKFTTRLGSTELADWASQIE